MTTKQHKSDSMSRDRYALYEASVQDAETEARLIRRIYRGARKTDPFQLREDFSGTALLASEWVTADTRAKAWAVDLDPEPLDWGREHRLPYLGEAARRLALIEGDVFEADTPRVDVLTALNFSYSIFKERATLLSYFKLARERLAPKGLFLIDVFGGEETGTVKKDHRDVPAFRLPDGTRMPKFRYTWHQATFNPLDHTMTCHIHFKLKDGTKLKKAFSYDWRLWSLPELRDLMREAGFASTDTYIHDFDNDGDSDEIYRKRTRYENTLGWVAYLAGWA